MKTIKKQWITFPPDWTWISVGFCYFVIGHLLPLSILNWMSHSSSFFQVLYTAWAIGGLAVIAFIIGFNSKNIAVLEAIIASLLYTIILNVAVANMWTQTMTLTGPLWMVLAFVTSAFSATIGEIVQSMKQNAPAS
jgi:hypothetical protein